MQKFKKLSYNEVETKKVSAFETSFSIKPLERGFGNTLGNVVRRTLLSSISGVAPFAIKIAGAAHEFQTITGVTEDVVQVILNSKTIRFVYNKEIFKDDEIIKVSLKGKKGQVFAKDLILPAGVEIVNPDHYIATTAKDGALEFELFLIAGRGFVGFDKNKDFILEVQAKIESKLKTGTIIAIDSDFSPVVKVSYESVEMNTSSAIIQERLTFNVTTDSSVEAKDAVAQAASILMAHLDVIANVSNLERDEIFAEKAAAAEKVSMTPISITSLDLSVRSYNCLKRAGYESIEDLSKLTKKDLKAINNLGAKSVEEIIEKLEENNVNLEGGE
ncbi:MAG: DNA-directed RNA polymerase subunit alpha [Mycoplasmataceae bacterium]|nr:DNA-directed RNA polymerase subunit alpha [Mycoplasmataceae bacterium]